MNTHILLSFVQNNYDFCRADSILSESNLNKNWKQWLTVELVHLFNGIEQASNVQTESYYLGTENKQKNTEDEQPALSYLRYRKKEGVDIVKEKRSASRCDFALEWEGVAQNFEIRCGNNVPSINKKELSKFEEDMDRIDTLKQNNPALSITALFAFYGVVSNQDMVLFKEMDNSKRCTYVLDTSLKGSSGIARLSQIKRAGNPRLCLAAYSV